jgi:AbrB family looped-hinge helix DNA binding protein
MERVTISSKGQIAIPKPIRDALNLTGGTKLNLEVQGHRIVLSKEPAWKKLRGMVAHDKDLMEKFAASGKKSVSVKTRVFDSWPIVEWIREGSRPSGLWMVC